jgi:4-diphosphocytidyl-2-C-methyl-D-erythritol kinase
MSAVSLRAHAKVNFYLEVGPPASRYHQIVTVLQSVTLFDVVAFTASERLTLRCNDPSLESDDNLALRAARLLLQETGSNRGAEIALSKTVPVGAGLGGGSADAAAALIGLNRLWGLGLSDGDLRALGARLGADVPFCLSGGTALARGFGELIEPLPDIDIGPFLIAKPSGSLSTAAVYRRFDIMETKVTRGVEPVLRAVKAGDRLALISGLSNDLEPAALSLLPEAASVKQAALDAGAAAAMVSGSGSAIIIVPRTPPEIDRIVEAIDGRADTFVVGCASRGAELIDDRGKAVIL